MSRYEKGSIGWLKEKAKKDGFDSVPEWNDWKKAKKDGFDSVPEWNDWKKKKEEKRNNGLMFHPCSKDFQDEAKRLSLTGNELIQKLREENTLVDPNEVRREEKEESARRLGLSDIKEVNKYYKNKTAENRGFKDINEYVKETGWDKGGSPMSENEDCSSYFGVHIVEKYYTRKILESRFGGIEKEMPYGNSGYDYVVKGGYKVDTKARSLINNTWSFQIRYNNVADYFLLWGFIDRYNMPICALLIHRDEIIRKRKFWKRDTFTITNIPIYLLQLNKYELKEELDKIKKDIEKGL